MTDLRLRRDLVWREADGETLASGGEFGKYVSANAAGSLLWSELAEGTSREDLAARLVAEFGIDADIAAHDVDVFVGELEANGLLER
jgi:hypothetical protein